MKLLKKIACYTLLLTITGQSLCGDSWWSRFTNYLSSWKNSAFATASSTGTWIKENPGKTTLAIGGLTAAGIACYLYKKNCNQPTKDPNSPGASIEQEKEIMAQNGAFPSLVATVNEYIDNDQIKKNGNDYSLKEEIGADAKIAIINTVIQAIKNDLKIEDVMDLTSLIKEQLYKHQSSSSSSSGSLEEINEQINSQVLNRLLNMIINIQNQELPSRYLSKEYIKNTINNEKSDARYKFFKDKLIQKFDQLQDQINERLRTLNIFESGPTFNTTKEESLQLLDKKLDSSSNAEIKDFIEQNITEENIINIIVKKSKPLITETEKPLSEKDQVAMINNFFKTVQEDRGELTEPSLEQDPNTSKLIYIWSYENHHSYLKRSNPLTKMIKLAVKLKLKTLKDLEEELPNNIRNASMPERISELNENINKLRATIIEYRNQISQNL